MCDAPNPRDVWIDLIDRVHPQMKENPGSDPRLREQNPRPLTPFQRNVSQLFPKRNF